MTNIEAVDYIKELLKDEYALNSKDRIVLTMAITALQQTAWIPVGERLPEPESETQKRGTYLTTNEYGSVGVNNYEFESGSGGFTGWSSRTNSWLPSDIRIIAWKPLPEPYKGGEDK